jgi:hypothetical protein
VKAALIFPSQNVYGNIIWMPPYLYPKEDLEKGLSKLVDKGYFVSLFPEGDGLKFNIKLSNEQISLDFIEVFAWVEFTFYPSADQCDYEKSIFQDQIVILPIGRLSIDFSFNHPSICLFPPGEFNVEQITLLELSGRPH